VVSDDPIFVTPGTVEVTVSEQGHEPATLKIAPTAAPGGAGGNGGAGNMGGTGADGILELRQAWP
jgi:hypothetical protein